MSGPVSEKTAVIMDTYAQEMAKVFQDKPELSIEQALRKIGNRTRRTSA